MFKSSYENLERKVYIHNFLYLTEDTWRTSRSVFKNVEYKVIVSDPSL